MSTPPKTMFGLTLSLWKWFFVKPECEMQCMRGDFMRVGDTYILNAQFYIFRMEAAKVQSFLPRPRLATRVPRKATVGREGDAIDVRPTLRKVPTSRNNLNQMGRQAPQAGSDAVPETGRVGDDPGARTTRKRKTCTPTKETCVDAARTSSGRVTTPSASASQRRA